MAYVHSPSLVHSNTETSVANYQNSLSAHLYEQTSITQYLSAANLSSTFIVNHLYKAGIIMDQIDLGTCKLPQLFVTYNSGYTIEGLSVLVDVAPAMSSEYALLYVYSSKSLNKLSAYIEDAIRCCNQTFKPDRNSCTINTLDEPD